MKAGHGTFVWYELMTTDTRAATRFYETVIGWTSEDSGMPDVDYTLLKADGIRVAGLMNMPDSARQMGIPPAWLGYVAVDDVDAAAEKLAALGGTVHRPPQDIPGVGRFSIVTDPHGGVLSLFKGIPQDEPLELDATKIGHVGWHELMAGNLKSDFAFYQTMFGWTKDTEVPMGDMGIYQLFAVNGPAIGGMMTKPAEIPAPYWGYYFNVDAIDAAGERVKSAGGQIIMGPMEVPGGAWILNCVDPQGAGFSLVSMKR